MRTVAESRRTWARWYGLFDDPSPFLKQLPTAVAIVLSLGLAAIFPELSYTFIVPFVLGPTIVMCATGFAIMLTIQHRHSGIVVLIVPMLDIVGLGMFRAGTGAAQSVFGSLLLLPVVWLAAAPGIRYVFVVAGLTSLAQLMPYFIHPPERAMDWLRGVITPIVFAAVAAVINELSRQQRARAEQAETLVRERTEALEERTRTIASLRESEREYRVLLDSFESLWESITVQAVIAVDIDGVIVEWNPGAERMLGMTRGQALGTIRFDRFLPKDVLNELADDRLEAGVERPESSMPEGLRRLFLRADFDHALDLDLDVMTAAGSRVPARATVSRRRELRNGPAGFIIVLTDESRTVEVARMKDEFVGMISHELRTPLSSIIGFLDLLRNDADQPLSADQTDFVNIIRRNADRLLALVGDLLFTAQAESGKFSLETREQDLRPIIEAALASARPHAHTQRIEVVEVLPNSPVVVSVDEQRIGQALDNLLSNAIKFTPPGGTVTAAVNNADGAVVIAIRDTGMGIPKDEQRMLFTRFFRASTATRNAVPGVGLGLTITRAIVLAHGGTMELTSTEGKGTEFRIVLPVPLRTQAVLMNLNAGPVH